MADRDEIDWQKRNGHYVEPEIIGEQWFTELCAIKGIDAETAKDIVKIYPSKTKLISSLKSGEHVPLVNKHVDILRKNYKED